MTNPTAVTPVDAGKLDELIDLFDGKEELAILFQEFFSDLTDRLQTIRGCLDAGSDVDVDQVAHAIKGSSSNLGAVGVQKAAESLETCALEHDVAGASEVFFRLEEELARLRIWLCQEHLL
ncbi:MAG TPA: Hpt domain-containing protein [Planctomycetota bacterium]